MRFQKILLYSMLAVVIAGIFYYSLQPIKNPDIYWLLRDSQYISQHGNIPKVDHYSYTVTGNSYYHNEILTKWIFGQVYRLHGFSSLIWFRSLIVAAFCLILVTFSNAPLQHKIPIMLLGYSCCFSRFFLSGELFSLVLLIASWILLLRFHTTKDYRIWWFFAIIQILWVNSHSGYLMGVMLLGLYCGGFFVDFMRKQQQITQQHFRYVVFGFSLAMIAIIFCNPFGYKYLFNSCYQHLTGEYPYAMRAIAHYGTQVIWQYPNSFNITSTMVLFAAFAVFVYDEKSFDAAIVFVIFGFVWISYRYPIRGPQYLGIVLAVVVLHKMAQIKPSQMPYMIRWVNITSVIIFVFLAYYAYPKWQSLETKSFDKFKIFWKENLPKRNWITNDFGVSTQMLWEFPEYKTFCDGRVFPFVDNKMEMQQNIQLIPYPGTAKTYPSIFNLQYTIHNDFISGNLHNSTMKWLTQHYQIRTIFMNSYLSSSQVIPYNTYFRPRIFLLEQSPEWQLVYVDIDRFVWIHKQDLTSEYRSFILQQLQNTDYSSVELVYASVIARQLGEYDIAFELLKKIPSQVSGYHRFIAQHNLCKIFIAKGMQKEAYNTVLNMQQILQFLAQPNLSQSANISSEEQHLLLLEGCVATADSLITLNNYKAAHQILLQTLNSKHSYRTPEMYLYLIRTSKKLGIQKTTEKYIQEGWQKFPDHWLWQKYLDE